MKTLRKISVIGDGGWGTTLAVHLAKKNFPVNLWGPFPEYIHQLSCTRVNIKFLPGVQIPPESRPRGYDGGHLAVPRLAARAGFESRPPKVGARISPPSGAVLARVAGLQ